MAIIHKKKVILVNHETSMWNPESSLGIYLTADKVSQCRLVAENRIENEEKKRKQKKDSHPKVAASTTSIRSVSEMPRLNEQYKVVSHQRINVHQPR